MKTAVLFGGQGTQFLGMGAGLPPGQGRELIDRASEITGWDLAKLARRGRPELERTELLQPSLVAVALGTWAWWLAERAEAPPGAVLGHSLGEVSAWAASGEVPLEDAVEIAAHRGREMALAARARPGAMASFPTSGGPALELAARAEGWVLASENTPDRVVYAGPEEGLHRLVRRYQGVRLPVSGAWHSPAMAAARPGFEKALRAVPRRTRARLWLSASTGQPFADDVPEALAAQLVLRIRWPRAIRSLISRGFRRFVVLGPGRPLVSWVRRCADPESVAIEWFPEPARPRSEVA